MTRQPEIVSVSYAPEKDKAPNTPEVKTELPPLVCRFQVGRVKMSFDKACDDAFLRTIIEEVLSSNV
jgi:hypothetical protein